jgi:hypothetical protein
MKRFIGHFFLSLVFVYDENRPKKSGKLMQHHTKFQNPSSVDHNFNIMRTKSDKVKIKIYMETGPIVPEISVVSVANVSPPVKHKK